jgi:peptide/nickel transport system permease protein
VFSQSIASEEALLRRQHVLGLDLPVFIQYWKYLAGLAHGDMGISWFGGQPVMFLIEQQLEATLSLASASMILSLLWGGVLGVLASMQIRYISQISRALTGIFMSLPNLLVGIVLIWLFAVRLDWLPATGQGDISHLVLPALVIGLSVGGSIARAIDAGVYEVVKQPFMRTALAKGLSRRRALWHHGLRVGLLPVIDIIALQFGYLLGGTVITESLFARQGVGSLLVVSILNKDIPVVLGIVVLSMFFYCLMNLFADVAHIWLDPRIRQDVIALGL